MAIMTSFMRRIIVLMATTFNLTAAQDDRLCNVTDHFINQPSSGPKVEIDPAQRLRLIQLYGKAITCTPSMDNSISNGSLRAQSSSSDYSETRLINRRLYQVRRLSSCVLYVWWFGVRRRWQVKHLASNLSWVVLWILVRLSSRRPITTTYSSL
jgi:hypothetical protein